MKAAETAWLFGVLGALILMLSLFKRHRRRSGAAAQAAQVKEKLPGWVRQTESMIFLVFMVEGLTGLVWLLKLSFPEMLRIAGVSAILNVMALMLPMIAIAMLGVNLISWLTPALRKANMAAMEGSSISFWSASRELIYFLIFSLVISALLLCLSVVAPWR